MNSENAYPHLLRPLDVGRTRLANRVVMGSMHTRLELRDNAIAREAAYYAARARGGTGLIVTGGYAPNPYGRMDEETPVLDSLDKARALQPIARAVHEYDTRICLQILHAGRYAQLGETVAPSPVPTRINKVAPRALTAAEVETTIEDFVRTVLENKARIVDELVEGRSLGELDADVMSELQRMLRRLDVSAESLRSREHGRDHLARVLRSAGEEYIRDQGERLGPETKAALVPVSEGAIQALAAVLAGPREQVYRIASSRDPGMRYTLEVIGADVTCDCRGFHYRGACTHARVLKDHLVSGEPVPDAYERVGEPAAAGAP